MNTFVMIADAAAAPAAEGAKSGAAEGGFTMMIPFIIIICVMFFFTMRSQKKQQQKYQTMVDKVVKGSRVLLKSGIYGNVVEVKEKTFIVEIAPNTKVEAVKNGIADVVEEENAAVEAAK